MPSKKKLILIKGDEVTEHIEIIYNKLDEITSTIDMILTWMDEIDNKEEGEVYEQ